MLFTIMCDPWNKYFFMSFKIPFTSLSLTADIYPSLFAFPARSMLRNLKNINNIVKKLILEISKYEKIIKIKFQIMFLSYI